MSSHGSEDKIRHQILFSETSSDNCPHLETPLNSQNIDKALKELDELDIKLLSNGKTLNFSDEETPVLADIIGSFKKSYTHMKQKNKQVSFDLDEKEKEFVLDQFVFFEVLFKKGPFFHTEQPNQQLKEIIKSLSECCKEYSILYTIYLALFSFGESFSTETFLAKFISECKPNMIANFDKSIVIKNCLENIKLYVSVYIFVRKAFHSVFSQKRTDLNQISEDLTRSSVIKLIKNSFSQNEAFKEIILKAFASSLAGLSYSFEPKKCQQFLESFIQIREEFFRTKVIPEERVFALANGLFTKVMRMVKWVVFMYRPPKSSENFAALEYALKKKELILPESNALECPVSYSELRSKEVVMLECKHILGKKVVAQIVSRQENIDYSSTLWNKEYAIECPICREEVNLKNSLELIF